MARYNTTEIIQKLKEKDVSLFTLNDFARIFSINNRNSLYQKAKRLKDKKIITQVIKGKYIFNLNRPNDFTLSNFIYQPSYISCESALSLFGIITGFSYHITSITTNKTKRYNFQNKDFYYSHIKPSLFWGYEKKDNFLIAEKEKALLDYFYLGLKGWKSLATDELDLSEINKEKLISFAKKSKNNRLLQFVKKI